MLATERSIQTDEVESSLRKTPNERSAVYDPIVAVDKRTNPVAAEKSLRNRNGSAVRLDRACRELRFHPERKVFPPQIPQAITSVEYVFRVVETGVRTVIAELERVRSGPRATAVIRGSSQVCFERSVTQKLGQLRIANRQFRLAITTLERSAKTEYKIATPQWFAGPEDLGETRARFDSIEIRRQVEIVVGKPPVHV